MTIGKRIGMDIDGVLSDWNGAYQDRIVQVTGRNLFPAPPFVPDQYHYAQRLGYTAAELAKVDASIQADDSFWFRLPMLAEAVDAYHKLMIWAMTGAYDVYFLTDRPGIGAKQQTERWLRARFTGLERPIPTVLITRSKSYAALALNLSIVVDDYHVNTQELALSVPSCRTYLVNRPYNQHQHAGIDVVRIDALAEMFEREKL